MEVKRADANIIIQNHLNSGSMIPLRLNAFDSEEAATNAAKYIVKWVEENGNHAACVGIGGSGKDWYVQIWKPNISPVAKEIQ